MDFVGALGGHPDEVNTKEQVRAAMGENSDRSTWHKNVIPTRECFAARVKAGIDIWDGSGGVVRTCGIVLHRSWVPDVSFWESVILSYKLATAVQTLSGGRS